MRNQLGVSHSAICPDWHPPVSEGSEVDGTGFQEIDGSDERRGEGYQDEEEENREGQEEEEEDVGSVLHSRRCKSSKTSASRAI